MQKTTRKKNKISFIKSLKGKLIIGFLAVGIIPALIVGLIGYSSSRSAITNQAISSYETIVESREATILEFLNGKAGRVEDFALDGFVISNLEQIGEDGSAEALTNELNKVSSVDPEIYELFVLDINGTVVASTLTASVGKDKSGDDYFVNGMSGTYIKDVYHSSSTGIDGFAVGAPIYSSADNLLGVTVARFGLTSLNAITTNREGMGETGETYIVNKDGLMITQSRFIEGATLTQEITSEPVQLFQSSGETMSGIYKDYNGNNVIGASMGDEIDAAWGLDWTVMAEIDAAEALAPASRQLTIFLIVLGSAIAGVVVVGYLVSRMIAKPLLSMVPVANAVAIGNLSRNVDIKTGDEIGMVGNAMARVIDYMKEMATHAESIAEGNLSIEIEPKSENDVLGNAFKEVVRTLRNLYDETQTLASTAVEGQLDKRGDDAKFTGAYGKIVRGVNSTLDAVINPLNVAAQYVERISKGDIPEKITDEYKGDFNDIKNNLNQCIDAITGLVDESGMLTGSRCRSIGETRRCKQVPGRFLKDSSWR